MKYFIAIFTTLTIFLFNNLCYADNANSPSMVSANTIIQGLDNAVAQIKLKTTVPVIFPTIIPTNQNLHTYFANSDLSQMQNGIDYTINVDATQNCSGAHYCNIGYVRAQKGGNPQVNYDMHNKQLTVSVILANNTKAYFTPGHAMADFFPAEIQWRDKNILYTLTWNTDQNSIIKMANSAIVAGPR